MHRKIEAKIQKKGPQCNGPSLSQQWNQHYAMYRYSMQVKIEPLPTRA